MASPHARPARSSSVARSLANAAAALRAHERSIARAHAHTDNTERQVSKNKSPPALNAHYSYSSEPRVTHAYDHEVLDIEVGERHRIPMYRQRIALEYDAPKVQSNQRLEDGNNPINTEPFHHALPRPQIDRNLLMPENRATLSIGLPQKEAINRNSDIVAVQHHPQSALLSVPIPAIEATKGQSNGQFLSTSKSNRNATLTTPRAQTIAIEDRKEGGIEKATKKRVRYLRETDRYDIIKRIERGEKQAALAREFGVTRAAICHMNKNRIGILSRYHSLVQTSTQETFCIVNDAFCSVLSDKNVGPFSERVHQVRTTSVLLLLTLLRDNRSNGATFRRVAGRLIRIILEETLADFGAESVEVTTDTGHVCRGLELRQNFCGVAIGAEGSPFLALFHQMEPDAPQGTIHIQAETDKHGQRYWRLDHMDLPANIIQCKVLLFAASCGSGNAECKAIEALCGVGCNERSIILVALLVASDAIVNISNQFSQVRIMTGGIDNCDNQTDKIVNGFGDFISRYNGI